MKRRDTSDERRETKMITQGTSICCSRRRACLFMALLAVLCVGASYGNAEDRIVRVGVYDNAPKIFMDPSGKPAGIFVDIIEDIAQSEGWTLRYVSGAWAEGLDRLARGEIDLMPDVAFTRDREKTFSFHKTPVMSSWSQVYARKDGNIQSIVDLNGKRVLALENSIQKETFDRLTNSFGLNVKLVSVTDYKTMFAMVAAGEADAAVTNRFYGLMHAKEAGLEDTAIIFEPSTLFFAASKHTPKKLLDAIDRRLSDMKEDTQSAYYTAMKRWTSEKVRFRLPVWMQILGLVAGMVLIMSLAGSVVLKRQVNVRTRELIQVAKKYRDIFENAAMGIYQSTPAGRFQSANPAFAKLFGYDTPEDLMENINDIQYDVYVNPDERLRFKKLFAEEGEVRGFEAQFKRRDGSLFWISIHGKAVYDDKGDILYYEGTVEDITARKEAEKELALYHEHLENLVKERTAELEIAKEKAEAADRIKSAFLATMSHELRTPLNSIIGFTGIILMERVGPLNDEQKKQLNMVRSSSQHLLALINDVLDISKIEAGQFQLAQEEVDLPPIIEKVAHSARPLAEGKGLELGCSIAPEINVVWGDARRVEQILLNLVGNAVKFTEKGSVRIVCEADADNIRVSVIDTGIGIREEDMETIFQAFRQIDSGLSRKFEGTGLGLSISKKLAELMGGKLQATSVWGAGSIFSFSLPGKR
ncbi:MAG: transporter substrate-binding domain-containing protein [Deltaproteobacteria bacterium]|nr:transporter substrate-binding domain-containing protein [Deltaproteobacteria bacterium]